VSGGIVCAILVTKFGFNIIYSVSLFSFLALLYSFFIPDHSKGAFSIIDSLQGKRIIQELKDFGSKPHLKKHMMYTFPFFFVLSFMPIILPLFIDAIGASLSMMGIVAALFSAPMLFEPYFSTLRQRKVLLLAMVFSALLFLAMFFCVQYYYDLCSHPALRNLLLCILPIHLRKVYETDAQERNWRTFSSGFFNQKLCGRVEPHCHRLHC